MTDHHPQGGPPLVVPALVSLAFSVAAAAVFASAPRPDTPGGTALDYFRDHRDRTGVVGFLVFATALPLAIYSATAYRRLRRLGVTAPGAAIALVGGVLAASATALSGLVTWATAHAAPDLGAGTTRALVGLSFAAGGMGFTTPLALLVAGLAVPGLLLRLLPRPLAVIGLVIAAVGAVSSLGLLTSALYPLLPVARFGGLLWLAVAGVVLPANRHRVAAAPTTAAALAR